jgi:hypothetical protein
VKEAQNNQKNLSNNQNVVSHQNKIVVERLKTDRAQALAHLEALGYMLGDNIYMRAFFPSDDPRSVEDKGRKANNLDFKQVEQWQREGRGIYFVVNGSGHRNSDVKFCRAIFIEHDNLDKELQRNLWQQLGLPEPSIQVDTGGKSIHSYWVFSLPIPVEDWKQLQTDLLEFADGDRAIKNPSRVMRLAGAWHIKADGTVNQSQIISNSGKRYGYEELREIVPLTLVLPVSTPDATKVQPDATKVQPDATKVQPDATKVQPDATKVQPDATKVQPGTTNSNKPDLKDFLEREIYPRLAAEQFYGEYAQLTKRGEEFRGVCPIHQGANNPTSFSVNPTSLQFHCYSCGAGGNPVQFLWLLGGRQGSPRGKDFIDVVQQLAEKAGVPMPNPNNKNPNTQLEDNNDTSQNMRRSAWSAPVSWEGEIGYWVKGKSKEENEDLMWQPKCNFDFVIEREIQDSRGGGFVVQAKLACSPSQHRIIIRSEDCYSPENFVKAIKRGLGRNVTCNLSKNELGALLAVRQSEYEQARGGKVYKAIDRYGQQEDGTWVFENVQYTKNGEVTDESKTGWVFTPELGEEDSIPCPKPAPPNPEALKKLIDAARVVFGPQNIHQFLLVVGWVVAGVQFQLIYNTEGAFPEINPYGDPGTGKTLAAEAALSLIGTNWASDGIISRTSLSAIYEHLKSTGSLPFIWDDPPRTEEVDEFAKVIYNLKPRIVRGNRQVPHSPIGYTSNHLIGGDQDATYTRIVRIPFVLDGNTAGVPALKAAQKTASGALPELIKLGYPKEKIAEVELELLPLLELAHHRVAWNLAIVTYYADAIAQMVGATENCLQWVKNNLCPVENDSDNNGNSLQDFITKVQALQTEDKVGSWNMRVNDSYVALYAESVWTAVDKTFHPATYNKKSLKAMVEKAGGKVDQIITFDASRDEVLAYNRALMTTGVDTDGNPIQPNRPRTVRKKAWLLPLNLFNLGATTSTTATEVQPEAVAVENPYVESNLDDFDSTATTTTNFLSEKKKEKEDAQGDIAIDEIQSSVGSQKSSSRQKHGCSGCSTPTQ